MCNSQGNKHTGLVSQCESKSAGDQLTDQLFCVACVIKLQVLLQQSTGIYSDSRAAGTPSHHMLKLIWVASNPLHWVNVYR